MGEGRHQEEKSHDPGGSTEPGGGKMKVKGCGASVPQSLHQMGRPQEEDHVGRSLKTGTFPQNKFAQVGHERGTMAHILLGCKTALT
ncbi:hypothetical protein N1851_017033 [Merluccius polli]|uniref:Uncharacterized protein n=1 Tax=Merluccius polli TaxID=89951 RepID=A0AA47MQZ1_MERPO|nr:hypothetical protein N1851_017033 [Merluccius polli]